MSKRDELITKYAADIKDKFGESADMDLLTKVTIGLVHQFTIWMPPRFLEETKRSWKRSRTII